MSTNIEWVRNPDGSKGETWNPISGCSAVSEGCRNCFAARMAATRLKHHPRYKNLAVIENGRARWTGEVRLNHGVLEQPLRWRKPRRVFVCSMSDLFHKSVSDEWHWKIFKIMAAADRHIYQVLTKHPSRMLEFCQSKWYRDLHSIYGLPNVWLGVSIENQAAADERIPLLLQTPAAVRFVSCEPLLSKVDLHLMSSDGYRMLSHWYGPDGFDKTGLQPEREQPKPDWVIVGSESGPGARPMDEDWVRGLRDQCQAAGVSFFYKQRIVNGRKVSMPMLDGCAWQEFPR